MADSAENRKTPAAHRGRKANALRSRGANCPTFPVSCRSQPLQLIEQSGELGTKSSGLVRLGPRESGVLPDYGKYGRTRKTFESHAPFRNVFGVFCIEEKGEIGIVGERDAVIP